MRPPSTIISVFIASLWFSFANSQEIPANSAPQLEKPDFQIETTQTKLIEVNEAPPLPGLPPVAGTVTLKVHSVADPGLPAPPQASELAENSEASTSATESPESEHESHIAHISATVYDRSRTKLISFPIGGGEPVTVWSNVDFNHFCGLSTFETTDTYGKTRSYYLLMGIGNETTEAESKTPTIPHIPDGTAAFVIETKNPNAESLKVIEDLHALYRDEGSKMAALSAAREEAYEEMKAHLLANPPKPKDVTVHFWKRETPTANTSATQP